MVHDVIIIGGGAAGFFAAINLGKLHPNLKILILERGAQVLEKVRVSGGGRCNVTHAVFEPRPLTTNYPRGNKELLGPFYSFMTGDTMSWFQELGIDLKIEDDGRVFPESDSSQTIIDCFIKQAAKYNVTVLTKSPVTAIEKQSDSWKILTKTEEFEAKYVIAATGSNTKILKLLSEKGVNVVPAVPSLFTFNIDDERIKDLAGLSAEASVILLGTDKKPLKLGKNHADLREIEGPVLITHWGMSGPGILKLSAWSARILNELDYKFFVQVNWLPQYSEEQLLDELKKFKKELAKQNISKWSPFDLPKRLWKNLVDAANLPASLKWADASGDDLYNLGQQLNSGVFHVDGKSTFKEEFVTAGGVDLKEIDFKTFASKRFEGLYLVGEILNVDAVTGGFNFQNAWTGGYLAAQALAEKFHL